jgi:hypothetical protein
MAIKHALLFVVLASLEMTASADTLRLRDGRQISGFFEGGTSRVVRFRTDSGVHEYDILTVSAVRIAGPADDVKPDTPKRLDEPGSSFGPQQVRLIRDWFAQPVNTSNLPPGLAKRETLSPGLERQLQRNGTLPPGLQRRVQPLPVALEQQLPPVPVGMRRVVIGVHVILLQDATSRIVDLIRNVW